jgi:hypothetical protein
LEARLAERLRGACSETRALGCYRSRFEQLLDRHDVLKAVRQHLIYDEPDSALSQLARIGRLDLAAEQIVLEPTYRDLFGEAELVAARRRLTYVRY